MFEEDGDFQNGSHSFSLTQKFILSSCKNSSIKYTKRPCLNNKKVGSNYGFEFRSINDLECFGDGWIGDFKHNSQLDALINFCADSKTIGTVNLGMEGENTKVLVRERGLLRNDGCSELTEKEVHLEREKALQKMGEVIETDGGPLCGMDISYSSDEERLVRSNGDSQGNANHLKDEMMVDHLHGVANVTPKQNMQPSEVHTDYSSIAINENGRHVIPGNKLLTEFSGIWITAKDETYLGSKSSRIRNPVLATHVRDTPPMSFIPGMPFCDMFRYLRGDCSHWFLSHFHLDYYQGHMRGFCLGKIYCSEITARLINQKIWIYFVQTAEMETNSIRSCSIHTLIDHIWYSYDLPKQEAVIQFVIGAIQAEAFNLKTLYLICSYTIGTHFVRVLNHLHCIKHWFLVNNNHKSNVYFLRRSKFDPREGICGGERGRERSKLGSGKWEVGMKSCTVSIAVLQSLREFVSLVSPVNIIPSVNNSDPQAADVMVSLLLRSNQL
ncbi:hypothetical protein AMTRI_Chr12g236830 [Amborella trichopoda]